ncbi:MAG TPA: L-threonine 3-dehydrogenase [Fimbriimonas sp.]|nr:L-threonine 3-dehydrogenase [Fimbriimonas sp.]
MKAIAKTRREPGVEIIEADEPHTGPGQVKIKLEAASVCGTDLHIYSWDGWSSSRVKPPLIIGHEFCGTIVELGEGVTDRQIGDFVASESHIVCGQCKQCLDGQAHVCVNTVILGVDIDGGFAEYAVIPWQNARPTDRSIPKEVAAFQDALGNAVHTALAGPLEGRTVLITGMGPIGLFAVGVCKAAGAAKVIATEISDFRIDLAKKMGVDLVLTPKEGLLRERIEQEAPGGVDVTLEMSGHPSSLRLAVEATRPGGRISLLGLYSDSIQPVDMNAVIFKGITMQGIVGRKLWETWDQMGDLLRSGKLDLTPVITHVMHYTEFQTAMELMKAGKAGKVVFTFK